jgi:hypothetical protein
MAYDLSLLTLRPGTTPRALPKIENALEEDRRGLLACWYTELGALNRVLILREHDASAEGAAKRARLGQEHNLFGIGEFLASASLDIFVPFDFLSPIQIGAIGPVFEVRSYMLKPQGLAPTYDLWRQAVPGRAALSPLLVAMYSATGPTPRLVHIWPYKSLDERQRIRGEAAKAGIWPPAGGPEHFASMQSDIYLPAPFSPIQ